MAEDVRDELEELRKKIRVREKKQCMTEDSIVTNLWNKIEQAQKDIHFQYEKEKELKAKSSAMQCLHKRIEELRIQAFKNSKNEELAKEKQRNKNKEVVRAGYT